MPPFSSARWKNCNKAKSALERGRFLHRLTAFVSHSKITCVTYPLTGGRNHARHLYRPDAREPCKRTSVLHHPCKAESRHRGKAHVAVRTFARGARLPQAGREGLRVHRIRAAGDRVGTGGRGQLAVYLLPVGCKYAKRAWLRQRAACVLHRGRAAAREVRRLHARRTEAEGMAFRPELCTPFWLRNGRCDARRLRAARAQLGRNKAALRPERDAAHRRQGAGRVLRHAVSVHPCARRGLAEILRRAGHTCPLCRGGQSRGGKIAPLRVQQLGGILRRRVSDGQSA